MWVYFNQYGTLLKQLIHGTPARKGVADSFEIVVVFDRETMVSSLYTPTIQFRAPSGTIGLEYPMEFVEERKFEKTSGEKSVYPFVDGKNYKVYRFSPQSSTVLAESGTYNATVRIYPGDVDVTDENADPGTVIVSGEIVFEVEDSVYNAPNGITEDQYTLLMNYISQIIGDYNSIVVIDSLEEEYVSSLVTGQVAFVKSENGFYKKNSNDEMILLELKAAKVSVEETVEGTLYGSDIEGGTVSVYSSTPGVSKSVWKLRHDGKIIWNHILNGSVVGSYEITLPRSSGTLATAEGVANNYVPYTGATKDVNLGRNSVLSEQKVEIAGRVYDEILRTTVDYQGLKIENISENRTTHDIYSGKVLRLDTESFTITSYVNGFLTRTSVLSFPSEIGTLATREWVNNNFQPVLTFDSAPTENSDNPVTSGGVFTAIRNAISNVYRYIATKTVAEINALNVSSLTVGDVYNVSNSGVLTNGNVSVVAGDDVAWTGSEWNKLAGTVDLFGYVPYTGAIQDVDLGDHELEAGYIGTVTGLRIGNPRSTTSGYGITMGTDSGDEYPYVAIWQNQTRLGDIYFPTVTAGQTKTLATTDQCTKLYKHEIIVRSANIPDTQEGKIVFLSTRATGFTSLSELYSEGFLVCANGSYVGTGTKVYAWALYLGVNSTFGLTVETSSGFHAYANTTMYGTDTVTGL